MLKAADPRIVPKTTSGVCRVALRQGNRYLTLRDNLGTIFDNAIFADLFSKRGRPAEAPWQLALVTIVQYAEKLSDRRAAEAVRTRLDLKYLLGLELDDPGFHFSVLSRFRNRLIKGDAEHLLLDAMLELCKTEGLVKRGGTARTDSTHILANARDLSRLEFVGETLRHALNEISKVQPAWLRCFLPTEWYDRYARRFEETYHNLTKRKGPTFVLQIGQDGWALLKAVLSNEAPKGLAKLPAVETLRRCWVEQFWLDEGELKFRESGSFPTGNTRLDTPYEVEARYSKKRHMSWIGYRVHLTESCDDSLPHLVTHVETTPAPIHDSKQALIIQNALIEKDLLPAEHLVDSAYVNTKLAWEAQQVGTKLMGPMSGRRQWQEREGGFDLPFFALDRESKVATCPAGKRSISWLTAKGRKEPGFVEVAFSTRDCRTCSLGHLCVKQPCKKARTIVFGRQEQIELVQQMKQQQTTPEWREKYKKRSGIEGTMSQGVHSTGLRRSRYRGLRRCHLHNLAAAAAINIQRLTDWAEHVPRSTTRRSRFLSLRA